MADTTGPTWRKATASQANGNCVEVATLPDGTIGVRDSKNPTGAVLVFTRARCGRGSTGPVRASSTI